MTTKYEAELIAWRDNEIDYEDCLHQHFREWDGWDWIDVYQEGVRMWHAMGLSDFKEGADYSPERGIIAAVSAQAAAGVCAALGEMLGVPGKEIESAIAHWYEAKGEMPAAVGFDGLRVEIEKARKFHEDLSAGRFDAEYGSDPATTGGGAP